jgi:hypothetical protein
MPESEADIEADQALPNVMKIVEVAHRGESAWAQAMRIKVLNKDGKEESYFMKVCTSQSK